MDFAQGHLISTTPEELVSVLDSCDFTTLTPRPAADTSLFPRLLDREMGFIVMEDSGSGSSSTRSTSNKRKTK